MTIEDSLLIKERVAIIVSVQSGFPLDDVTPESTLVGDLDLDSLDRIELAMQLEDEFGIEIPDRDVSHKELGTVAGLTLYVQGKLFKETVSAKG